MHIPVESECILILDSYSSCHCNLVWKSCNIFYNLNHSVIILQQIQYYHNMWYTWHRTQTGLYTLDQAWSLLLASGVTILRLVMRTTKALCCCVTSQWIAMPNASKGKKTWSIYTPVYIRYTHVHIHAHIAHSRIIRVRNFNTYMIQA